MGTDRNENWLGTLQQVIMTIWAAIVDKENSTMNQSSQISLFLNSADGASDAFYLKFLENTNFSFSKWPV